MPRARRSQGKSDYGREGRGSPQTTQAFHSQDDIQCAAIHFDDSFVEILCRLVIRSPRPSVFSTPGFASSTASGLWHVLQSWVIVSFSIRRGVRSVMTAKTSREVGMSEIVGVGAPGDLQVGEHVPIVNFSNLCARPGDITETLR